MSKSDEAVKFTKSVKRSFVIVDGSSAICIVALDPPSILRFELAEIAAICRQNGRSSDPSDLEEIAVSMCGYTHGPVKDYVIAWAKSVRQINLDGSLGKDCSDQDKVNACFVVSEAVEQFSFRGKR